MSFVGTIPGRDARRAGGVTRSSELIGLLFGFVGCSYMFIEVRLLISVDELYVVLTFLLDLTLGK